MIDASTNLTPIVLSMLLLGLITYFYRFSFLSKVGSHWAEKIPAPLLRLLGPAAFSAIIVNNLMASRAHPELFKAKLFVAALSLIVAAISKSIIVTLIFGLGLLYLWGHYPLF